MQTVSYEGLREGQEATSNARGRCTVIAVEEDGCMYPLKAADDMVYTNYYHMSPVTIKRNNVILSSRQLFEWGNPSMESHNLAYSILSDFSGLASVPDEVVLAFRKEIIENLDVYCWSLSYSFIQEWVVGFITRNELEM